MSDNLIQVERIYSNSKITRQIEYFKNGTTKVVNSNENEMTSAEAQKILGISPYGEDMTFIYVILLIFVLFIVFCFFCFVMFFVSVLLAVVYVLLCF